MRRLLLALLFVLAAGGVASADPYFNSTECPTNGAGVPTDPNLLMCDDFDDGVWYSDCSNPLLAINDGWQGDPGRGGVCSGTPGPPNTVAGGAVGTAFAARSVCADGTNSGSCALGYKGFYPSDAAYDEVYFRWYMRPTNWTTNNAMKWMSLTSGAYTGGIAHGGQFTQNPLTPRASPGYDCQFEGPTASPYIYKNSQDTAAGGASYCYLSQNPSITGNAAITMQNGRWYHVEVRVKLNTVCTSVIANGPNACRNGFWQMWIDDCGTNGLGCTGTPTLRASYNNVAWRGNGPIANTGGAAGVSSQIGAWWQDIWGNPSDGGTMDLDQFIASKAFIGFMNGAAVAQPPGVPTSLRVCRGTNCTP